MEYELGKQLEQIAQGIGILIEQNNRMLDIFSEQINDSETVQEEKNLK